MFLHTLMTTKHKIKALSVDDLLKQQEGPTRKKRRLSESNVSSEPEGSGSSEEQSESDSGGSSDDSLPGVWDDDDDDNDDDKGEKGDEVSKHYTQESALFELDVNGRLGSFDRTKSSRNATASSQTAESPRLPTSFSSLGISAPLQSALKAMSIKAPTEVQSACIPPLLAGEYVYLPPLNSQLNVLCLGRDCIGNAKTGSGKTIAFALPILQKLVKDPYGIFALVLTPTR